MEKTEQIGIFGGTFNPPHTGHIQGAQWAMERLKLSRVLMIPSRQNPAKHFSPDALTPEQRLQMLRLAAEEYPGLEVWDGEIRREGSSYTYQTLQELEAQYPGGEFTLILGSDIFRDFTKWRESRFLAEHARIAVLLRGAKGEKQALAQGQAALSQWGITAAVLENPLEEISSTQVRRLLAFGCGDAFLDPKVLQYIQKNRLYHVGEDWKHLPMERLEPIVVSLLDPGRVNHVLGCRDTAVALAERWGADVTDAARAGILHDITKALDGPLQLTLCSAYGKILDDFSRKYPRTLHALTGSLVAERIFGENPQVVSAICSHTTGKADMNLLETIIYVADYMEPNRNFPGVERLRELAFSDIYGALKLGLEMTLEHLKEQGSQVSPASAEALAYLNQNPK